MKAIQSVLKKPQSAFLCHAENIYHLPVIKIIFCQILNFPLIILMFHIVESLQTIRLRLRRIFRGNVCMRIAVLGSGISGLGAAYLSHFSHQVTLYEVSDRIGGHSNTVDAVFADRTVPVDTGFIVYNAHNYP